LDKQRNETKYDKIMLYLNKFKILDGSMDMQKDFVKNTKVIEMLNWKYSMNSFFDNLDWEF